MCMMELRFGKYCSYVPLNGDNPATLHAIWNLLFSFSTKHIAICDSYICELVAERDITTTYTWTNNTAADIVIRYVNKHRLQLFLDIKTNFQGSSR